MNNNKEEKETSDSGDAQDKEPCFEFDIDVEMDGGEFPEYGKTIPGTHT